MRRLLAQFAAVAFLVLGSGLLLAKLATDAVIERVEQDELRDKLAQSRLAFELAARRARQQVEEYAFRDETFRLAQHPGEASAIDNFKRTLVDRLPRGDYTFTTLLEAGRQPAYVWSATEAMHEPALATAGALIDRLERTSSVAGFLREGDALYLVAGASVHRRGPTAGPSTTHGYLVIGRPVDAAFLETLPTASLFETSVHRAAATARDSGDVFVAEGDSLVVRYPLSGIDDRPTATIEVRDSRSGIDRIAHWTLYGAIIAFLFGAAGFRFVWRYGRRLLITPLRVVAEELEGMHQRGELTEVRSAAPSKEWALFLRTFNTTVRSLRDSEQRYRTLFDHSVDPYFLLAAEDRTVLDANPAALALTERSREQLVGVPLPESLRASDGTGDVVRIRRAGGAILSLGVAETSVLIDGRRVILAAYRDLTDREALAQSQKMDAIGSLAGGLAHDFNNLMGSVLAGVRVARSSGADDPRGRTALDTIEHAARRAAELTRQLLGVSRHEPLVRVAVDVRSALANVRDLCTNAFDPRIRIVLAVPPLLPSVESDQVHLEQALLNLCINARDAMPEGGTLRLEARAEDRSSDAREGGGRSVVVRVSDDGAGMSEEVQRRMFEPFFTTKERGKGTGLGLPMVYGFARNAGGRVAVDSTSGRGTTVEIILPAVGPALPMQVEHDTTAAEPPAIADPPGGRALILLADDEAGLREMLRMVLEHEGFAVVEAADGRTAVELVRELGPSLTAALLDVQMPVLDGVAALQEIQRLDPALPTLLGTGYVSDDDLDALRVAGAEDLLTKPYDIRALIERLRRAATVRAASSAGATAPHRATNTAQ